jgi:exosortase/archaeosortase family protein
VLNIFKWNIDKQESVKTGRFLFYFVIFYLVISWIINTAFPLIVVEEFVAWITLLFLNLIGYSGEMIIQEPVLIVLNNNVTIAISELCTGLMELFIVSAAIMGSHGIAWKLRIAGAIGAAIVLQVLNFFRIFVTLIVILAGSTLDTIEFTHNILFRLFLFVVIAGVYMVWFLWATKYQAVDSAVHDLFEGMEQ